MRQVRTRKTRRDVEKRFLLRYLQGSERYSQPNASSVYGVLLNVQELCVDGDVAGPVESLAVATKRYFGAVDRAQLQITERQFQAWKRRWLGIEWRRRPAIPVVDPTQIPKAAQRFPHVPGSMARNLLEGWRR